jgi:diaminohydroxyphosphoribosylaminopyrimidine deaminase/5-amino-6-(5-phosphoribosylamino)uracil reductase
MREALELARLGRGQTSPNPMVGAVLVQGGEVVGRGFHTYAAKKHAEIIALDQARERARGATLFINLEPCSHQGRTGPCADALIAAGVRRVVAAMEDPNPLVAGEGFRKLRAAGIGVEIAGEYTEEAEKLNEAFVHFMRTGRPLVTLKSALTLDGKIAAKRGAHEWITSETARAHVQQLRHETDAILTGIGTVLADDCLLTDRSGGERSRPLLRLVLDSRLRIPLNSRMLASCNSDLVVVATSAAPQERLAEMALRGIPVLALDGAGGRTDLRRAIEYLAQEKCLSLMIEAGSEVNQAAFEAGIVDKVFLYYAPKILGGADSVSIARPAKPVRLRDLTLDPIAPDEFAVEAYVV